MKSGDCIANKNKERPVVRPLLSNCAANGGTHQFFPLLSYLFTDKKEPPEGRLT
jgi:hypothetical protein